MQNYFVLLVLDVMTIYMIIVLDIVIIILLYLFILYFFVQSIYQSLHNLILQITAEGLTTPCSRWVQRFVILCAGAVNEVLHDSPTRLITLIS